MIEATTTGRRWRGTASWLAAAVAAGLLVVAATAPILDARLAIVVVALPLGVGVMRSCVGSGLTNADRAHRGLVAAAWTATILVGAVVGFLVAVIVLFWALFGGM